MRIICILLSFLFLSCNGQEKNKSVSTVKTEVRMELKVLSYNDWYSSSLDAVKSNVHIEDYVKDNILQAIKSVSKEKYSLLKQTSKEVRNSENFKDFYVFHFSEGEVVTNKLYYFFSDGSTAKRTSLNISEGKASLKEPIAIPQSVFIEVNILPIDNENQYQDIAILTDVKEGNVVSNLGNPNEGLAKTLD